MSAKTYLTGVQNEPAATRKAAKAILVDRKQQRQIPMEGGGGGVFY
jgi:hypothetical protein